jgi:hypothetical protein
MTLYAHASLWELLVRDNNEGALEAFEARLEHCEYALYRVRRLYAGKGNARRSVERRVTGTRQECLRGFFGRAGKIERDAHGFLRRYVRKAEPGVYPTAEEMLVVGPALAGEKSRASFESQWRKNLTVIPSK